GGARGVPQVLHGRGRHRGYGGVRAGVAAGVWRGGSWACEQPCPGTARRESRVIDGAWPKTLSIHFGYVECTLRNKTTAGATVVGCKRNGNAGRDRAGGRRAHGSQCFPGCHYRVCVVHVPGRGPGDGGRGGRPFAGW